jgi:hypothetical protein
MPQDSREALLEHCYRYCVKRMLWEVAQIMQEYYIPERVTFIHDSGPMFPVAHSAFEMAKKDPSVNSEQFVSFVPMDWQDCILLQPADMMAYDGFKVCGKRLQGEADAKRKSLDALRQKRMPLIVGHLAPGGFTEYFEEWKKTRKGNPNRTK